VLPGGDGLGELLGLGDGVGPGPDAGLAPVGYDADKEIPHMFLPRAIRM
jgi:hypothetical protein